MTIVKGEYRDLSPSLKQELLVLLEEVIRLDKADMGNIQFYFSDEGALRVVAQKGFKDDFLKHFASVKPFDSSACGRAMGLASTIIISDINEDIAYYSHREIANSAGFRAVKSVPLINENKKVIGVISTHFKEMLSRSDSNDITAPISEIVRLFDSVS